MRSWIERRALLRAWSTCCIALCACQGSPSPAVVPPGDDATFAAFQLTVYPILMRDCSFIACHGAPQRFFQVFGPGRTRLGMELKSENPATMLELQTSYDRARSMLVTDGPVARSLLLSKPLEAKVGGVGHRGIDGFGRNVYASRQDPSYSALATWAAAVVATDGKAQQGAPGATGMASGALAGAGAAGRR